MTPKEKAQELVDKFYQRFPLTMDVITRRGDLSWEYDSWNEAKQCGLIAVDEMIQTAKDVFEHCWNHISWKAQYDIVDMNKYLCYLEEVKEEINKL
jgi:hypothetical protein